MPPEQKDSKEQKENVIMQGVSLPPRLVATLADEVAKTVVQRLPHMMRRGSSSQKKKQQKKKQEKKLEHSYFLDTSAIIDGRIFDVIGLGFLQGADVVLTESILLELKHIADSQDMVKRERGKNGLLYLDKAKKAKRVKIQVLSDKEFAGKDRKREVDEMLIRAAKANKAKVITCDYNLEKKASIEGVIAVNVNALANALKIRAVPGESLHIKLLHPGKDITQGVGYLDDGTMIVVERGSMDVGKTVDVVVARVIQTAAGRILFAKKI